MQVRRMAAVAALILMSAGAWSAPVAGQAPHEAAVTGVTQISAGEGHTCVRLSSGQVRCAGANSLYQLGDGSNTPRDRGVSVQNPAGTGPLTGVRQVASGSQNTCALLTSGQVRCWGYGGNGGTGHGTFDPAPRPVTVVGTTGTGALTNVTQLTGGDAFSCARLSNGQARCWGYGTYGQLGDNVSHISNRPTVVSNVAGTGALIGVAQVSANNGWACARLTNGQVRCWGHNSAGLGNGTTTNRLRPIVVRNPANTGPLTGVTQLAVGASTACAVLESGQVRCWGRNVTGALGNGRTTSTGLPVTVKAPAGTGPLTNVTQVTMGGQASESGGEATFGDHGCARLATGQLRCWGSNNYGQLGTGVPGTNALRPVAVQNPSGTGPLTGVAQVSAYHEFTCARLTSGQVRCWGVDDSGQLGNGPAGASSLPVTFTIA